MRGKAIPTRCDTVHDQNIIIDRNEISSVAVIGIGIGEEILPVQAMKFFS